MLCGGVGAEGMGVERWRGARWSEFWRKADGGEDKQALT